MVADGAGSGERIGVAYVDIEGRLDGLMRSLVEVERASDQSMQRVRASGGLTAEGIYEVSEAADDAGLGLTEMASIGLLFRKVWKDGLLETINGVRGLSAAGAAATAIFARLGVAILAALPPLLIFAAIVAAVNAISFAIEGVVTTIDAMGNAFALTSKAMSDDAAKSKQAIQDIGDELERIPVIGRLISGSFKYVAGQVKGDMDLIGEGAKGIRDTFREIPILGTYIIAPINDAKDAILGNTAAIEEQIATWQRLREEAEIFGRISVGTSREVSKALSDEMRLRNMLALASLEGVERVREAERQRIEAERQAAGERVRALQQQRQEELKNIRDRLEVTKLFRQGALDEEGAGRELQARGATGGLIRQEDADVMIARINAQFDRAEQELASADQKLRIQSSRLADQRIREAEQQVQDEADRLAAAEAKKADAQQQAMEDAARRRMSQVRSIYAEIIRSQLEAEGRTSEAQALAIRVTYQEQIEAAILDNDRQRAALLANLRDRRIREVYEAERKIAEAEVAARREQGSRIIDELASIDRDIRRGQLDQDDQAGLAAFDINSEFDDRVRRVTDRIAKLREELAKLREGGVTGSERDQMALIAQQVELLEAVGERLEVLRGIRLGSIGSDLAGAAAASGRSSQEFAAVNANRFAINGVQGTTDSAMNQDRERNELLKQIAKNTKNPTARFGK